jgi:hypothetical protein
MQRSSEVQVKEIYDCRFVWARSIESEDRRQMTEERGFNGVNIEQQNKEPQNDEVITSTFPPEADSIFCVSKRRQLG